MPATEADRRRLQTLQTRLRALELHLPHPHGHGIHKVAVEALTAEIHALARRLNEGAYWRSPPRRRDSA